MLIRVFIRNEPLYFTSFWTEYKAFTIFNYWDVISLRMRIKQPDIRLLRKRLLYRIESWSKWQLEHTIDYRDLPAHRCLVLLTYETDLLTYKKDMGFSDSPALNSLTVFMTSTVQNSEIYIRLKFDNIWILFHRNGWRN